MKLSTVSTFIFTILLSASSWSATEGETCVGGTDMPTCSGTGAVLLYCPEAPAAGEDPLPEGITADTWTAFDCAANFTLAVPVALMAPPITASLQLADSVSSHSNKPLSLAKVAVALAVTRM